MEITRIRAGSVIDEEVESVLDEIVAFDELVNAASGLGEDFDPEPAEVRRDLTTETDYMARTTWLVRINGDLVAKGSVCLPLADNVGSADVWCAVHPAHRGQGIGGQLLAVMEEEMRLAGRTQLTSYCEMPAVVRNAAPRRSHVAAESGAGSLPSGQPAVAFLLRHGYAFKQLERCSVAQTSSHSVFTADDPGAVADDDYVIETWQGPTPEHRLVQIAELHQRMSTDVPGSAEFGEEENWDGERVRVLDSERTAASEIVHTALALRDGTAAGFTEIAQYEGCPEVGWQGATLVAQDHRGHGLGARLKIANHRALAERSSAERVYTWNAVENSWMLAINDLAGFETWAWVGLWKKTLDKASE